VARGLTPTTGTVTPKLGKLGLEWWAFTAFFNMAGQPAISLPLHWSKEGSAEGSAKELPVGVQLGAAYGREDVLIRLAAQLEQARPWSARIPAVHA